MLHFLYTDSYTLWPGREDPPRMVRWAYPMVKLHTELPGSGMSDAVATQISFRFFLRSFYRGFWVYTFRLFRNWLLFPFSFSVSVFGDVFQRWIVSEKTFEHLWTEDSGRWDQGWWGLVPSRWVDVCVSIGMIWNGSCDLCYFPSFVLVQQLVQQGQKQRSMFWLSQMFQCSARTNRSPFNMPYKRAVKSARIRQKDIVATLAIVLL